MTPTGGGLRIGALTSLGMLERDRAMKEMLPLLAAAVRSTAGPAVRNLGTLGGNIAGRTGCLLPALLALDARLEIASRAGRTIVPLVQWLADAPSTELIEAVIDSAAARRQRDGPIARSACVLPSRRTWPGSPG